MSVIFRFWSGGLRSAMGNRYTGRRVKITFTAFFPMPEPSLADALTRYDITLSKSKQEKIDEYCRLLWEWNSRLNLTRHDTYEKFVGRDLVDTLALSEFIRPEERVLDVGTGGGVPGVVLAILRPDLKIELCDSTGKKAMAVSEIIRDLRLDIPVWHAKAEAVLAKRAKGTRFTTLTIRAVSRLVKLLQMVGPHWNIIDRLLLVKGPRWPEERGEARHFNLMTKLALRCLKTYPTPLFGEGEQGQTIDSVILQVCRKDSFEQLDTVIDAHKNEEPAEPREFRRGPFRERKFRKKGTNRRGR